MWKARLARPFGISKWIFWPVIGVIILGLALRAVILIGLTPAPPTAIPTLIPSATPHPTEWVSQLKPEDVIKDAGLVPPLGSLKVAPHPTEPDKPYLFTAYGNYVSEWVNNHTALMSGKVGSDGIHSDELNILIPVDLIDAFPDKGKTMRIDGLVMEVFDANGNSVGYIQVAQQIGWRDN